MYTRTLDEGQFKEKFLEALEYRLEKVSHQVYSFERYVSIP